MKYIKDNKELIIENIFNDAKNYISENNIVDNSYHNNKHIFDVFDNSILLFDIYKNEYNLNINDKLCLGLAALFHDFGHSGGELTDDQNIEIALGELDYYLDNYTDIYEEFENNYNRISTQKYRT